MRKLAAVLCVVLMLAMAAPALANPSISDLAVALSLVQTEEPLEEGAFIVAQEANPSLYSNADVRDVVSAVNSPVATMTVKEAVDALGANLPDAEAYDFVTGFSDLAIVNGADVEFDNNGAVVKATVKLAFDALKGETDLSNYLIMLINPETGEVTFIELDPANFDPATGEITVDFPYLGAFSLIQK